MNKDLLQNIILEEADNEYAMLDEGFWDKVKARTSGALAGTKQAAKNAKSMAKNFANRLVHGEEKNEVEDGRGDSVKAYNVTKFETWKKSMTTKIRKFEDIMIKKVEALIKEIYSDAKDIGLDDVVGDETSKIKVLKPVIKGACTRIGKIIDPDYSEKRTPEQQ